MRWTWTVEENEMRRREKPTHTLILVAPECIAFLGRVLAYISVIGPIVAYL